MLEGSPLPYKDEPEPGGPSGRWARCGPQRPLGRRRGILRLGEGVELLEAGTGTQRLRTAFSGRPAKAFSARVRHLLPRLLLDFVLAPRVHAHLMQDAGVGMAQVMQAKG